MGKYIVNPIRVRMQQSDLGTVYQSIIAMGYRARQINDDIKTEIQNRMEDVIITSDETEGSNFDQISISREFDKYPKPTFLSMKEMYDGQIHWEYPEDQDEEINPFAGKM